MQSDERALIYTGRPMATPRKYHTKRNPLALDKPPVIPTRSEREALELKQMKERLLRRARSAREREAQIERGISKVESDEVSHRRLAIQGGQIKHTGTALERAVRETMAALVGDASANPNAYREHRDGK